MEYHSRKSVRFVSFSPRTPSPESSNTSESWGSSPGPSTPPPLSPTYSSPRVARHNEYPTWQGMPQSPTSPHGYSTFSPTAADVPQVDQLLEVHPSPADLSLFWDISTHPENIRVGNTHSPTARELTQFEASRCAAWIPSGKRNSLPLQTVVLIFPGVPLEVEVIPSANAQWSDRPLPYVTVGDLLYGLYKSLRISIHQDDYERLSVSEREALRLAFEARLQRDPEHHAQNLERGFRRIDYLGDMRIFLGIRPACHDEIPPARRGEEVFMVELGCAPE
ncbi:hypothetical protein C8Q77DRAFT_1147365 [Trametes polyzona]|nr:hypothetical protein C8Q77DRAFT_1147365 [Trametes polyzona]